MITRFLSLLLTTVPLLSQAQFSLTTCQEKAKANYPLIRQYNLIEQSEEYTLSNVGKAYLPQISATAIAGYIIQGLPSLGPAETSGEKFQLIGIAQINQTLWDGGATRTQKEMIRAQVDVEKANVDVAFHYLQERVNQLFFGILLLDEQLKHTALLTDNLNRNLKAVKLSKENGLAYSSDVDEVQVELLKTEQRITELTYSRRAYANMLALMMGEPTDGNLMLMKPQLDDPLSDNAISRPELSLYQSQRRQAEANYSKDKVGNMPKVGLLGAGVMIRPGMPFGTEKMQSLAIAGLSVSWNTRSLYQSSNNSQLAKLQLDRINNQQETFLFNTKLQLHREAGEVEKQRLILGRDNDIVNLKTKIRMAYELKYENGLCSMNDLLQATHSENEARANQSLHEVQLLMSISNHNTTAGN